MKLSLEQALHVVAGFMVILSAVLTMTVSEHFVWFTVFIGANLFQMGFTKMCPMLTILRKLGFKSATCPVDSSDK